MDLHLFSIVCNRVEQFCIMDYTKPTSKKINNLMVPRSLGCSLRHLSPYRQVPLKKYGHTVSFFALKKSNDSNVKVI